MRFLLATVLAMAVAQPALAQDISLKQILVPGEGWKPVPLKVKSIGSLTADAAGRVYLSDPEDGKILRIGEDGQAEVFAGSAGIISELRAAPGDRLIGFEEMQTSGEQGKKASGKKAAAEQGERGVAKNRVVVFDAEGKKSTLLPDFTGEQLAIGPRSGRIYLTGKRKNSATWGVYELTRDDEKVKLTRRSALPEALAFAGPFAFSPDEGTVAAIIAPTGWLHALQVIKSGQLTNLQPYWSLRAVPGQEEIVDDLLFDSEGRLFAASQMGVQVFDPTGRLSGVLLDPVWAAPPAKADAEPELEDETKVMTFGGPKGDRLYLAIGKRLFVRTVKAKGLRPKS